MFAAVALMCMENDLKSCSQMIWKDTFISAEACELHNASIMGGLGPKGYVVMTSCFKVDDLGQPA